MTAADVYAIIGILAALMLAILATEARDALRAWRGR